MQNMYEYFKRQMEAESSPFLSTGLGKLAPEIREKIFIELLATPPPYAGHVFASHSSGTERSSDTPMTFVDIEASWYKVAGTCRQIYLECQPLFFAAKAYYLAGPRYQAPFFFEPEFRRPLFRYENITALCLRDLVKRTAVYSPQRIDEVFSDPTNCLARYSTRQELEAMIIMQIPPYLALSLGKLMKLRTLSLCFKVGEEMEHVNFLFGLTGMRRGLVEFLDDRRWLIRPQSAEGIWKTQYACFTDADYRKDKDNQTIPFDLCEIELAVTDIDSRAPALQDGDERYVEVQIQRPPSHEPLEENGVGVPSGASSGPSDVGVFGTGSHQIQLETSHSHVDFDYLAEISEDEGGTIAELGPESRGSDVGVFGTGSHQYQLETSHSHVEDNHIAEISEDEGTVAELAPESLGSDLSGVVNPQSDHGLDSQTNTLTNQPRDNALPQTTSGALRIAQPGTESHQIEEFSFPRSSVAEPNCGSSDIENHQEVANQPILLHAKVGDSHDPKDTQAADQAPVVADLQRGCEFHAETEIGADEVQETFEEKMEAEDGRTKAKYLSSRRRMPFTDVVDTPCPYTEEEMESYEEWQRSGTTLQSAESTRVKFPPPTAQTIAEQPVIKTSVFPDPRAVLRYLLDFIRLLASLLILALLKVAIDPDDEHFCGQLIALYSAVVLVFLVTCVGIER